MFFKSVAFASLVAAVIILSILASSNANLIRPYFEVHQITTSTTSSEGVQLANPETLFTAATVFLVLAMFFGILLVVVAIKMGSST